MLHLIKKDNINKLQNCISFLDIVLQVCIDFKNSKINQFDEIYFRNPEEPNIWYKTREKGWGNQLCHCVYNAILSETKYLETAYSPQIDKIQKININCDFNIEEKKLKEKNEKNLSDKIEMFLVNLQNSFTDEVLTKRLISQCETFLKERERISCAKTVFALRNYEIDRYLSSYYDLLSTCVICYNRFEQSEERSELIDTLLHLDINSCAEEGNYQLDFRAPIVLCKIQKIIIGIEEFYEKIIQMTNNSMLQNIYKHIMIAKAQHIFNWYIPEQNNALFLTKITSYLEEETDELQFQITAKNINKYNSYEGIGELRLGEKIIYEYNLLNKKDISRFEVAIMGDLHLKPLVELRNYVMSKIASGSSVPSDFILNVYTKNDLGNTSELSIVYQGEPGDVLRNREKLNEVITKNQIVFLLDCIELYQTPRVLAKESFDFIKQKYAFSDYDEYITGAQKNIDISVNNSLEDIYETLTCEQCFKQLGKVEKVANAQLLDFCEKKQKELGNKSTIYIYVSDLHAFDNIYNDDQYYIRTEKYNEKEIGIIRYSSEQVSSLPLTGKNQMLVFSAWQFIKNVAIEEKEDFCKELTLSADAYRNMDKICIGIDYSDWPKQLVIHHSTESEYDKAANRFIKDILLPIMNNRGQDMFITYVKKAMYSFFYSAAKSVDDMLFLHLFQNKEKLFGKVAMAEANDEEKVRENINKDYKYSSKRFYDMIMKNYDISSNSYVGQMKTYQIISKNEKLHNDIRKEDIYKNVIQSCNNLSYEYGYLAKNCRKELN